MTRDPRERSRLRGAVAVGLALLASGCSFRIVRPAPARDEWPNPVLASSSQVGCTDSPAPPIVDTGVAGVLGSIAYIERHSGSPPLTIGIGLAALPFLVSAIYGYIDTAQCRRYERLFTPAP